MDLLVSTYIKYYTYFSSLDSTMTKTTMILKIMIIILYMHGYFGKYSRKNTKHLTWEIKFMYH
jgi:hypothetical protein